MSLLNKHRKKPEVFVFIQLSRVPSTLGLGLELWDIAYLQLKRFICTAAYAVLCFFSILRLLLIKAFPLRDGEVFVAGFAVAGMLAILMLTEVLGPYDMFLVFPMALNAGSLLAGVTASGRNNPVPGILGLTKWGVACALALFTAHQCLAALVNSTGFSFPAFGSVQNSVALGAAEEVHSSHSRVSLAFRDFGDRIVPAKKVMTSIPMPTALLNSPEIRFFVSGDQRMRRFYSADSGWKDLPVTYAVRIGKDTVAAGPLSELNSPRFFVHKFSEHLKNGNGSEIRGCFKT